MDVNLYQRNTPANFWKVTTPIEEEVWETAICDTLKQLGYPCSTLDDYLHWSLGEGSYGYGCWQLSFPKQVYYLCKPIIPQFASRILRQILYKGKHQSPMQCIYWPIDDRYVQYLWMVLRSVMNLLGRTELEIIGFWPDRKQNAFVLTHDIETEAGQKNVRQVAEIDEELGFRSAFFFVLQRYKLDMGLIRTLIDRGFEVGIHGYNHDGKLFCFSSCPLKRINRINEFARELNAHSFRSPMTLRNPERMQHLDLDYDLSFFDTDPYEPMPGGTMSIFPFEMGTWIELPYTLPQEYTLFELLHQPTAQIWKAKLAFLRQYHGMILLDSHPDYLRLRNNTDKYKEFLQELSDDEESLFHATPAEVGSWWKRRMEMSSVAAVDGATIAHVHLDTKVQKLTLER